MVFKKIETTRKSVYAAEQLLSVIRDGTYKIGDQSPPERELAERMGISRPLIREALSALQIAGIIESRPGDGTYVRRAIGDANLEECVLSVLEEGRDPIEVLEARMILEEGIVKLASKRAQPEDLIKMKKFLVLEKNAAMDGDYQGYVKADQGFHLAIVATSRNLLLKTKVRPLIAVMGQELWRGLDQLYVFNTQGITQTMREHKRILEAITKRDASKKPRSKLRGIEKQSLKDLIGVDRHAEV